MIDFLNRLRTMSIQKNVKKSFEEIKKLQSGNDCDFTFVPINKTENAEFCKKENKYIVTILTNYDYQAFSKTIFDSKINIEGDVYNSRDALITSISIGALPKIKYEITISNLEKGKKSKFYRLILPLEKDLCFNVFTAYPFCFNCAGWSRELIKTYIAGREFHIFKLSDDSRKYLFIDCIKEIEYKEFYNQVVCILCALGVLTGYFVEKECFILSSDEISFSKILYVEFRSLRESKYAPYKILPDNPYSFFSSNVAHSKYYLMAHIFNDVFTKLVNKINLSLVFENSLFIFLEALSYPLDTQPACLSVVLEGVCNYINENNEKSVKPITDKKKANELKKEMKSLLNKYSSYFSQDGRLIIEKRIDDINSPTNRAKFEKSISLLGIELTDYEKEALLNRNTFLHCTTELKTEYIEIKQDSPEYVKLFFASQILVRFLYKIILKIIGYEGNIVNTLKYNEEFFESIKNEPMLMKI